MIYNWEMWSSNGPDSIYNLAVHSFAKPKPMTNMFTVAFSVASLNGVQQVSSMSSRSEEAESGSRMHSAAVEYLRAERDACLDTVVCQQELAT